jgi:hypothetical protein
MLRFGFKNFQVREIWDRALHKNVAQISLIHIICTQNAVKDVLTHLIPDMCLILLDGSADALPFSKELHSLLPSEEEKKLSTNKITNLALALLCLATL